MITLLWIEIVSKLAIGGLLIVSPTLLIKVLGLPRSSSAFWPRLVGALLVGMAAAMFMDISLRLGHGMSLGGSFVINVALALALLADLISRNDMKPWRGRMVKWIALATLSTLAFVEIAHL